MLDGDLQPPPKRIKFNMPRLFCPKCSSVKDVIPIEYGYPGEGMMEEENTRFMCMDFRR